MEHENARLRAALEKAERELREEQRLRKAAQRLREEEQHRREEEQHRREEEQHRREEEQHRREDAERAAASAVPKNLTGFLQSCHALYKKLIPVDDSSCGTAGVVTNPVSSLFPQKILQWEDFAERQQETWNALDNAAGLWDELLYPPTTVFEYLGLNIDPIGSENELRQLQWITLENMVKLMREQIVKSRHSPDQMNRAGQVSFENQEKFRAFETASLSTKKAAPKSSGEVHTVRKNTRADQFCVLWEEDGTARPLIAIEYKAPHKLTIGSISAGLESEIHTERDVFNSDEADPGFQSRRLLTAVITQLFSYMIDKQVTYGYICTGQAFIFVRIPEDPTIVYYSVSNPKKDCEADPENSLQRTAVSQVFAFIMQALLEKRPSQEWVHNAKTKLKRWEVEFENILAMIPETVRKSLQASEYRPRKWPKRTKRCAGQIPNKSRKDDDPDDDSTGIYGSPSYRVLTRSRAAAKRSASQSRGTDRSEGENRTQNTHAGTHIQDRPYCSHECLLGLSEGRAVDRSCPNAAEHGPEHMSKDCFLQQVRLQLASDRGSNADCCPLYIHGSRGALLKVRLTSRGYTLVAKATDDAHMTYLAHEARVYDRLQTLQGRYIPVSCGISPLDIPYYYDGVELRHILLLSWGGRCLAKLMRNRENFAKIRPLCRGQSENAYRAIHALQVLHCDAEPRNMLFDDKTKMLMLVDFERSKIGTRPPLREVSDNRRRSPAEQASMGQYKKELSHVLNSL